MCSIGSEAIMLDYIVSADDGHGLMTVKVKVRVSDSVVPYIDGSTVSIERVIVISTRRVAPFALLYDFRLNFKIPELSSTNSTSDVAVFVV